MISHGQVEKSKKAGDGGDGKKEGGALLVELVRGLCHSDCQLYIGGSSCCPAINFYVPRWLTYSANWTFYIQLTALHIVTDVAIEYTIV